MLENWPAGGRLTFLVCNKTMLGGQLSICTIAHPHYREPMKTRQLSLLEAAHLVSCSGDSDCDDDNDNQCDGDDGDYDDGGDGGNGGDSGDSGGPIKNGGKKTTLCKG